MTVHFCSFELLRFGVARLPDQSLRVSSKSFSKKTNNFISVANYFMFFSWQFSSFCFEKHDMVAAQHIILSKVLIKKCNILKCISTWYLINITQNSCNWQVFISLQCLLCKPNIWLDIAKTMMGELSDIWKSPNYHMYVAKQIILLSEEGNRKIGTIQ